MSTKTTIQNLIDTNLASGSDIAATEHRAVLTSVLNELYPSVITDTQASTNVFTASNATDRTYNLKIVKQGRCVTISGRLKNTLDSIISNVPFAEITTSEFLPSDLTTYYGFGESGIVRITLNTSGILTIVSPMGGASEIDVNFTYFTLN